MTHNTDETPNIWEVKEIVADAIALHEAKKEGVFVPKYDLELYKKDVENRLVDLERAAEERRKTYNRWFWMVTSGVVSMAIPTILTWLGSLPGGGR